MTNIFKEKIIEALSLQNLDKDIQAKTLQELEDWVTEAVFEAIYQKLDEDERDQFLDKMASSMGEGLEYLYDRIANLEEIITLTARQAVKDFKATKLGK